MKIWSQKNVRIILSLALLVMITIIQMVGILHTHSESFIKTQTRLAIHNGSKTDIGLSKPDEKCLSSTGEELNLSLHCKICELTYHQHLSFIVSDVPASLDLFPEVIKIPVPVKCCKLFQLAVQCWTNKGPPALIAIV
jgi:hypothetical protein